MKHELMFSGIGGQGVMVIGELLCTAAVKKGYNATFYPSYGQEKRGGRTMCQIVLSEELGSPVISAADVLLVMDNNSLFDLEQAVKAGGYLVVNSSMVDRVTTRTDVTIIQVPVYEIAREAGSPQAANMAAMGAVLGCFDAMSLLEIKQELADIAGRNKSSLADINLRALDAGYSYVQKHYKI